MGTFNRGEFRRAFGHTLTFGRHKGQSYGNLAAHPRGLRYLAWLRTYFSGRGKDDHPEDAAAFETVMTNPTVAAEVARVVEES